MISGLLVFHKKNPGGAERIPQGLPLWSFKTCLRSIHFSWLSEGELAPTDHDFDIYRGQDAYEFILEILCGLHSPVVGETEVFGQFKAFWQKQNAEYPLNAIFDNIIADVKQVRKEHLKDLGSQSYGSLVRRLLPKQSNIAIIGGGSLVKDILPWVYKDENEITLYVRDKSKTKELRTLFPRIQVSLLSESITEKNVIIAAPVQASSVEIAVVDQDSLVIDLRGESRQDPCQNFKNYKDLNQFFKAIEKNKSKISEAKAAALETINYISQKRFFAENFRPFGWEDICAW